MVSLDVLFQLYHVHPILIHRHTDDLGLVAGKSLQRPQERRRFAKDYIAGIDEDLGKQLDPLAGTCERYDMVRRRLDAAFFQHRQDAFPKRRIAFRSTIL